MRLTAGGGSYRKGAGDPSDAPYEARCFHKRAKAKWRVGENGDRHRGAEVEDKEGHSPAAAGQWLLARLLSSYP